MLGFGARVEVGGGGSCMWSGTSCLGLAVSAAFIHSIMRPFIHSFFLSFIHKISH